MNSRMKQIKKMLSGIPGSYQRQISLKALNKEEIGKNITCNGCNCPLDIIMNPEGGARIKILTSPSYAMVNFERSNCTWNVTATEGKVTLLIDKLNIKWSEGCRGENHLYLGSVFRHTEVWLCGTGTPRFTGFKSKNRSLIIKFRSDQLDNNHGFKAFLIANG